MRCAAIAEEAKSRGFECLLVGNITGIDWLQKYIKDIGLDTFKDSNSIPNNATKDDVLIIDSYTLKTSDPFLDPKNWKFIASIADSKTPDFISDLVFHPGIDIDWFSGNQDKLFFGFDYVPVRTSIRKSANSGRSKVSKIVIFGGGVDAFGISLEMAREISVIPDFDAAVFISHDAEVIENIDKRFRVIPFGKDLDSELHEADLVITTASTSSMEIIAREIPLAVLSAVDNQVSFYRELGMRNLAACIGERSLSDSWSIDSEKLQKIIKDENYRFNILKNMKNTIDLNGSKRIVDRILEYCE